ncbi:transcriptional repressor TCF25-domain-containing protein [Phyllosticta capitalensis]|uniref:Nulp1-pending protein-like protein n=1 Tax=Phyllosticta capitalensis TaxID=121624 RepID=A0ABR1YD84_9PEZI
MSTRALRKAQRELEEKKRLEELAADEDESEEEVAQPKASMFAMLGGEDDGNDDEDEDEQEEPSKQESEEEAPRPQASSSKKKKKKKKKAKATKAADENEATSTMDEIDRALQSLSVTESKTQASDEPQQDPASQELFRLLSIDSQGLHAQNEMRKLFGRAALERDTEEPAGRQRGRGARQMGLANAVAGRNARGGGLVSLGLRRNIFIQGKEEWPRATSGGLSMEVVEKRADGTIEYRYVHSGAYQDVQRQFEACVASMDPQRLVQLLQFNPYHISTLLQVSDIAKQERDHATSGDLLERALFSFGRSVHSTFSNSVSQGKARMDFRRPENREFWLAAWRYIANLGMRSTWRTVYEWTKLLLSLDPENDPYCVRLVIDQFAIRGRQQQDFLTLAQSDFFKSRWNGLPNIDMTSSLAFVQTSQMGQGRQALYSAIGRYPWLAARLFQELEINDTPPGIWGKQPRSPYEHLVTELYVIRAKDLWNTAEAKSLLIEVASAVHSATPKDDADQPITRDVARHTILTDNPALISAVPRPLTAQVQSSSDPLPPEDNLPSYDATPTTSRRVPVFEPHQVEAELREEHSNLRAFFESLVPWFRAPEQGGDGAQRLEPDLQNQEVVDRMRETGLSFQEIWERAQRFENLQGALEALGQVDQADAELHDWMVEDGEEPETEDNAEGHERQDDADRT